MKQILYSLLGGVLAFATLSIALVAWEISAAPTQKPSIMARVWRGELPSADPVEIEKKLKADIAKATEEKLKAQESLAQVTEANKNLLEATQQLEGRIQEKTTTDWAGIAPQEAAPSIPTSTE